MVLPTPAAFFAEKARREAEAALAEKRAHAEMISDAITVIVADIEERLNVECCDEGDIVVKVFEDTYRKRAQEEIAAGVADQVGPAWEFTCEWKVGYDCSGRVITGQRVCAWELARKLRRQGETE